MKNLLGDFSVKVGREDIFKPTTGNKSSHKIRVINFATSKNLVVKRSDVLSLQHS
jgi:hypothetical protein